MAKQVDIKNFLTEAERKSKTKCPIALALKAAFDAGEVEVNGSKATIRRSGEPDQIVDIGQDISETIRHYDETGEWNGKTEIFLLDPYDQLFHKPEPIGSYQRD